MPELRWTLLILGAIFIVALAVWEVMRQRHIRGKEFSQGREGERLAPTLEDDVSESTESPRENDSYEMTRGASRVHREPTLTLPDLEMDEQGSLHRVAPEVSRGEAPDSRSSPPERSDADRAERRHLDDPPVFEMDEGSLEGLMVDGEPAVDAFTLPGAKRAAPVEIPTISPRDEASTPARTEQSGDVDPDSARHEDASAEKAIEQSTAAVEEVAAKEPEKPFSLPEDAAPPVEAIVDWPDETDRKIIALRLVSGLGERFTGRAVRLALSAEGFVLGRFDIFHKAGPDNRALLSAASLTKPGTFSLATMDGQRMGGISLFAVLPGPLPAREAFDELLSTARSLNNRLQGALQDERGEPLTPVRCANIRDNLVAVVSSSVMKEAPVLMPADPQDVKVPEHESKH